MSERMTVKEQAAGTAICMADGLIHGIVWLLIIPAVLAGITAFASVPSLVGQSTSLQTQLNAAFAQHHAWVVGEQNDTTGNDAVVFGRPAPIDPPLVSTRMRRHPPAESQLSGRSARSSGYVQKTKWVNQPTHVKGAYWPVRQDPSS